MSLVRSLRDYRFICLLWLAAAFVVTVPAYLWHQEFFRNTGAFYTGVRCLPVLCVLAFFYARWRGPLHRKWELRMLIAFPILASFAVHPLPALVVAGVAIAALAMGDVLTPFMHFEEHDAPVMWAAGYGALILIVALLGKAGLLSVPWLAAVLTLALLRAAVRWRQLIGWVTEPFARWSASDIRGEPLASICFFFLFLFAGCSLLMLLAPVTTFDVLAYHFPLARYYAQTQSIQPVAAILQSYFPQGGETLMALGFTFGGAETAQLLMPFLGVLFLWLLVLTGRACGLNPVACLAGAAIASTFPFLHWTLSVPKDDAALALFQLAALYCFLQWQLGRGGRWILLGSFFLGQTAGIKHVALFGLVAIAPLWFWSWMRDSWPWRRIALAAVLFAATGLFWHAQTYVATGNALYPEGAGRIAHTPSQEHRTGRFGPVMRYLTLPWYLEFRGTKAFESITANPLGVFLFLFAPAVAWVAFTGKWTPARKACLCFALVYVAYWASVSSTLRYAIVPFALLALATGAAVVRLVLTGVLWQRNFALLACAYGFLFSLAAILTFEVNSLQLLYALRRVTAKEYLQAAIPTTGPLFRLAALHPGASVFGIANCSRYYAPNSMRFACALCQDGCREEDMTVPLETKRFDYVIIPNDPAYGGIRRLLHSRFGGSPIDADSRFTTFQLGAAK